MPIYVQLAIAVSIAALAWYFISYKRKPKPQNKWGLEEGVGTVETEPYRATFGSWTCTHKPFGARRFLTIKGKSVGVDSSPFCEECTIAYFEKYSTLCEKCGDVIAPGMPVGQHWITLDNGEHKLITTCQKFKCALPGNICGHWGEGKINSMPWGSPDVQRPPAEETPATKEEVETERPPTVIN